VTVYAIKEPSTRIALTEEQQRQDWCRVYFAAANARLVLKRGDRVRVRKCPGTLRWIIFDHWDGYWMVSKSGIDDYAPSSVDRVNGKAVDFCPDIPSPLLGETA
jgi:hypothetical protein